MSDYRAAEKYVRLRHQLNLKKDRVEELQAEIEVEEENLQEFAAYQLDIQGWREVDRFQAMEDEEATHV